MSAPGAALLDAVASAIGRRPLRPVQSVGGGSISAAWRVAAPDGPLLLKLAAVGAVDMFGAEAEGLEAIAATGSLLTGHAPPASLLHGDLWSGNQATDSDGQPVIFDPAVYHGDRETDLAMTRLFGGGYAAQAERLMVDLLQA